MKKQLFTAIAVLASLCGYAQTKGTSAVGLGISLTTSESTNNMFPSDQTGKIRNSSFSLGYGYFIKDNVKIGFNLLYSDLSNKYSGSPESEKTRTQGISLNYQQYIPVFKTFYAFAGGRARYSRTETKYSEGAVFNKDHDYNIYGLGVNGGLAWFINKRWAIETELLSAEASYGDYKSFDDTFSGHQTAFNLSTTGIINDLGFKIFFTF